MRVLIRPERCPHCQQPLSLPYAVRRHARLQLPALMLIIGGPILGVALLAVFWMAIANFTDEMGLRRKERGLVFALPVPISVVVAWFAFRIALRLPRVLAVKCPGCMVAVLCQITEGWGDADPSATAEPQFAAEAARGEEDAIQLLAREARIMLVAGQPTGAILARLIEAGLDRAQADAFLAMVQHGQAPPPTVVWQISMPGWFATPGDSDHRGQRPERPKVSESLPDPTLEFEAAESFSQLAVRQVHRRHWYSKLVYILILLAVVIVSVCALLLQ